MLPLWKWNTWLDMLKLGAKVRLKLGFIVLLQMDCLEGLWEALCWLADLWRSRGSQALGSPVNPRLTPSV